MVVVAVYPREKLEPFLPYMIFSENDTTKLSSSSAAFGGGSTVFTYFLSTLYVLLFLSGIIGNTWAGSVIISLFKNRSREPPRNVQFYILVLCIVDLVVLAFMPLTIDDHLHGEWTFTRSSLICKLYLCSDLISKFFAPIILMALSGTCYMVVCRRQCRDFPDDLRAGFAVTILAAGVLIVLMTPVYLYGDLYYLVVYERADVSASGSSNGTSSSTSSVIKYLALKCMFQSNEMSSSSSSSKNEAHSSVRGGGGGGGRISDFVLYTFVVGYVVPATAFTLFYALVWRFVRSHSWRVAGSLVNSWRVARTVLGLISFFLVCWTPYWAMLLYSNARPQYRPSDRNPIALAFAYITHLLPYINCLGYPIIYIALNRKIKENYEMIKAKRRSQILALCGLKRKGGGDSSSKRRRSTITTTKGNEPSGGGTTEQKVEAETGLIADQQPPKIAEEAATAGRESTDNELDVGSPGGLSRVSSPRSRSQNGSIDNASGGTGTGTGSADSQSLFTNVHELIELSRHILIPLIEIHDANEKIGSSNNNEKRRNSNRRESGGVERHQPDVAL